MRFFRELGVKSLQFLPLVEHDPTSPHGVGPISINPITCGLPWNTRICLGWTTQRKTGPRATGQ
jgi:hypothetical protein